MGFVSKGSIPPVEAKVIRGANLAVFRPKAPVYYGGGCFKACSGGVLMQNQVEGLQPLAFMSKVLKPSERRYLVYQPELATIAYCFLQ